MSWRLGALALLGALGSAAAAPAQETVLIRGARIFDGTGAPATPGDVLVRRGRIAAVGVRLRAPRRSRVVDARGLTLLPGLHDLHTHLRSPAVDAPDDLGKAWAAYLVNGVTSVNDFSVSGEMLAPIRETAASGALPAPHLQLAIRLGVPGGHGTEYGWGRAFTLEAATPRSARLAMARALPYRPDVIKVFADGWRYGRSPALADMNEPTLAAIVAEAHKAGIPVITHSVTLAGAKIAVSAGVDALGHGIGDALADDALIALMKAHGTAYIPTLTAYEPQQERVLLAVERDRLSPAERAREEGRRAAPVPALEAERWAVMQENVRRLKAAGIPIAIGTDAGVGGVYHGSSTLREIGLLTRLGFTPAEALAAATGRSAAIVRKESGRIAPGRSADLVVTGGRPDERIEDLYDIRRVFVAGREVALDRLRRERDGDDRSPLPVHRMAGPILTGAGDRTSLGTLPAEGTDSGADHSHLDAVAGPGGRTFLVAAMGAAAQPFADFVLPLTPGAIQLADARGFTGISLELRGSGRYALLIDSFGIPPRGRFRSRLEADSTLREVRLPFSAFKSPDSRFELDLSALRALAIRLEGEPGGSAWLELGQVRFY